MSWGAGQFPEGIYNQTIPGTYINIKVTPTLTQEPAGRGYLGCPISLPWGPDDELLRVTYDEYATDCYNIFGYTLGSEELAFVDEMFKNATTLYLYRLNGGGKVAKGTLGRAKYSGSFGNKITVAVDVNVDDENYYDVITYVDGVAVDTQVVPKGAEKTASISEGNVEEGNKDTAEGELAETDVTFTTEGNVTTAKVTGLPEGYTIVPKLTFENGMIVGQIPGRIDLETTKDTVTLTLGTAAPNKANYKLAIQVRKDSKTYVLKTQTLSLQINEEGKTGADVDYISDNSFVVFNKEGVLEVNGGDVFSGGSDGTVTALSHEKARNAFETVYLNVIAVPSTDQEIQDAYISYVKRLRDEFGIKFQIVLPAINRQESINYEGVIEYINKVTNPIVDMTTDLCYWLAGAEAGCQVQSSCTAKVYDGRFDISANVTRSDQRRAIQKGQILFHTVGDDKVILRDLNTLIKIEKADQTRKSLDFSSNQVVRVFDGIMIETANVFNNFFLGRRNNDDTQRAELRNQLLKVRERYAQIGAIAPYDQSLLTINAGAKPNEVIGRDGIMPLQAMEILYFTIEYVNQ